MVKAGTTLTDPNINKPYIFGDNAKSDLIIEDVII